MNFRLLAPKRVSCCSAHGQLYTWTSQAAVRLSMPFMGQQSSPKADVPSISLTERVLDPILAFGAELPDQVIGSERLMLLPVLSGSTLFQVVRRVGRKILRGDQHEKVAGVVR